MGYITLDQTNKETECHQHTFPTYTGHHSSAAGYPVGSECLWFILMILRQTAIRGFPVLPDIKTNILLTWGKILIQNLMYCFMIIRWAIRYLSSLPSPLQTRLRTSSMVVIRLLVGNIWLSRHKMGNETTFLTSSNAGDLWTTLRQWQSRSPLFTVLGTGHMWLRIT